MIKAFVTAFVLTFSTAAISGPHHGHRHWHHHRAPVVVQHYNWVAPAVGGLIIGAAIANATSTPQVIERIDTPKVVECTEWREVMYSDGRIVKERTCIQR